ncbi:MAG: hypothetical protein ABIA04_06855 [Pseudomonadota bacterium]
MINELLLTYNKFLPPLISVILISFCMIPLVIALLVFISLFVAKIDAAIRNVKFGQIFNHLNKSIFIQKTSRGIEKTILISFLVLVVFFLCFSILLIPFSDKVFLLTTGANLVLIISLLLSVKLSFMVYHFFVSCKSLRDSNVYTYINIFVAAFIIIISSLSALIISETGNLGEIVSFQGTTPLRWNICHNPFSFVLAVLYFISMFLLLELNPFDSRTLASKKLGLMQNYFKINKDINKMIKYALIFLFSLIFVLIFLGGWNFSVEKTYQHKETLSDLFKPCLLLLKTTIMVYFILYLNHKLISPDYKKLTKFSTLGLLIVCLVSFLFFIAYYFIFGNEFLFDLWINS